MELDDDQRRDDRKKEIADNLNNAVSCTVNYIPIDLTAEILSRLPIKSIGRFMLVSKHWRDLITSRRFSSMHATNKPFSTLLSTSHSVGHYRVHMVEFFENGESVVTMNLKTMALLGADSTSFACVVGSCNGLLCLQEFIGRGETSFISILNPITNESTVITHHSEGEPTDVGHYRFGYSPSTDEYKVLRRCTVVLDDGTRQPVDEILTVGVDKSWRKLSECVRLSHQVLCKGTFYWLVSGSKIDGQSYHYMFAFDLAQEKTQRTSIPPLLTEETCLRLLVLNDHLGLFGHRQVDMVLWRKEENGDSWSQVFVVPYIIYGADITPIDCTTKHGGGILFRVERTSKGHLIYCPKLGKYSAVRIPSNAYHWFEFVPTFWSSNAIMQKGKS